jgi:hypothetical protein
VVVVTGIPPWLVGPYYYIPITPIPYLHCPKHMIR